MDTAEQVVPSDIYTGYAAAYDRSGQIRFAVLMNMYIHDVLQRHAMPDTTMIDLACGTGTLALLRAEAGWDVIGLDQSPAMLAEARRKSYASNSSIELMRGDMRSFSIDDPVALATCFYDSLNYLLDDDELRGCFASVYAALEPGGAFCFDFATDYFLREYWRGTEVYEEGAYHQTMHSSYDEDRRLSTLVLDGVTRGDDGTEQRFREIHVERGYEHHEIEALLLSVGFVCEACYDCFTFEQPNERSLRTFWVARKPTDVGQA